MNGGEGGGGGGVSLYRYSDDCDPFKCSSTKTHLLCELVDEVTDCSGVGMSIYGGQSQ